MNAIQSQGFPAAFWNTLVITLTSVVLILICCSMCAWFITRVKTWYSKALYYLFVFSMVVPFQMVMFHSQPAEFGHAVQYLHHLFGLWRGTGCVYVLWFYEIRPH